MSNSWIDAQNGTDAVCALAGSDTVWASVQTYRAVQLIGVVAFPILLTIASEWYPPMAPAASFVSIILALLDATLIAPNLEKKRKLAAQLQDRFDAIVFGLKRSHARELEDPNANEIREYAEQQPPSRSKRNKDWYSPVLGNLPIAAGRIACMFESATWDLSLRKKWIAAIKVSLYLFLIGFAGSIVLVPITGRTVFELGLIPLMPLFIWLLRELSEQRSACELMTQITTGLNALWSAACQRQSELILNEGAIELTQTFRTYRALMSPVPHWLYMQLRPFQQKSSGLAAEDRVREYEASSSQP